MEREKEKYKSRKREVQRETRERERVKKRTHRGKAQRDKGRKERRRKRHKTRRTKITEIHARPRRGRLTLTTTVDRYGQNTEQVGKRSRIQNVFLRIRLPEQHLHFHEWLQFSFATVQLGKVFVEQTRRATDHRRRRHALHAREAKDKEGDTERRETKQDQDNNKVSKQIKRLRSNAKKAVESSKGK